MWKLEFLELKQPNSSRDIFGNHKPLTWLHSVECERTVFNREISTKASNRISSHSNRLELSRNVIGWRIARRHIHRYESKSIVNPHPLPTSRIPNLISNIFAIKQFRNGKTWNQPALQRKPKTKRNKNEEKWLIIIYIGMVSMVKRQHTAYTFPISPNNNINAKIMEPIISEWKHKQRKRHTAVRTEWRCHSIYLRISIIQIIFGCNEHRSAEPKLEYLA